MNISGLINRNMNPKPWAEGEKIPWDNPEFSQRMLEQHLSQDHDAASRRISIIDEQVEWIHKHILEGSISKILDLGCGPGLYTARLSRLGHICHGIDYSPASIKFACQHAPANCSYTLSDLREADFGSGFDLITFIFGEFNVFNPGDTLLILNKIYSSLKSGGKLLLEVSSFDSLYDRGNQPATWYSAQNDLFARRPHLCLMESFWDEERCVAIERYYIIDADNNELTRHSASMQAYLVEDLKNLLHQVGFDFIKVYPSLIGKEHPSQNEMYVILSRKR